MAIWCMFGKNGIFQAIMIENAIPELEDEATASGPGHTTTPCI